MDATKKNTAKTGCITGIIGLIAAIFVVLSENCLIGIFGGIASAGVAQKGHRDLKN